MQYFYDCVVKHPSLRKDKTKLAFDSLYSTIAYSVKNIESLIDAMTKLTVILCDGHTNIEIPYTSSSLCLNILCEWKDDKLVLKADWEGLHADDEIVMIDDIAIEQVVYFMTERIPHENIFLVKSRMIEYPYQNYHVFSQMNLSQIVGKKNTYIVTFLHDGKLIEKKCQLEAYNGFLNFEGNENFVSYKMFNDTAVLYLDECKCDNKYKQTLQRLAISCQENSVSTLIVDLSKNMGGSSAVIEEFIKYVNIPAYHFYEMIDYSDEITKIITKRDDTIINQVEMPCFPKNILCKVSHTTFSSARTFAVTLKDNGISKIIGTPTGGKPNSYGMPQKYQTPNNKIRFRVSRCEFLRPNKLFDGEIALFPDY